MISKTVKVSIKLLISGVFVFVVSTIYIILPNSEHAVISTLKEHL